MNRKLNPQPSPDFPTLINKLAHQGVGMAQLAKLTGTSTSTIDRVKNTGLMPRYDVGSSLLMISSEYGVDG